MFMQENGSLVHAVDGVNRNKIRLADQGSIYRAPFIPVLSLSIKQRCARPYAEPNHVVDYVEWHCESASLIISLLH